MSHFLKHIPIQQWAEEDRPREKMLNKGRLALSEAELLAILLGTGTARLSAVDLAREVLKQCNNSLDELAKMSIAELTKIKGIGPAKAITLASAMELTRRRASIQPAKKAVIRKSDDVYEHMKPYMLDLVHEEFWVLYLNRANIIMKTSKISSGGMTGTVVDPRLLFREALENLANSIILVHNHPSGTLKPSEADEKLTKKLVEAGSFLDIQVLDHLIFTDKGFYSFADHGTIL